MQVADADARRRGWRRRSSASQQTAPVHLVDLAWRRQFDRDRIVDSIPSFATRTTAGPSAAGRTNPVSVTVTTVESLDVKVDDAVTSPLLPSLSTPCIDSCCDSLARRNVMYAGACKLMRTGGAFTVANTRVVCPALAADTDRAATGMRRDDTIGIDSRYSGELGAVRRADKRWRQIEGTPSGYSAADSQRHIVVSQLDNARHYD